MSDSALEVCAKKAGGHIHIVGTVMGCDLFLLLLLLLLRPIMVFLLRLGAIRGFPKSVLGRVARAHGLLLPTIRGFTAEL